MTAPQRFPAHTLDADQYAATFAVFVSRSHEYPAILRRLAGAAESLPEGFACLDIGAGPGMVIRDWMAQGGRLPARYVAIEPIEAHVAQLRTTLSKLELDSEVIAKGFGADFQVPGSYDLVLFSHSLYWLRDPARCVQNAYRALNPGGLVVAFLQSPLGCHPMFKLFDPLLDRDRPNGPDHGLSSHELVQGLRACGLQPEVAFDPTPIDLTGLFDPGAEQERDALISFCLQVDFARLGEPLKSDVIAYLRAACVEQNGRLNWYEPNATVTVRRPAD